MNLNRPVFVVMHSPNSTRCSNGPTSKLRHRQPTAMEQRSYWSGGYKS